MDFWTFLTTLVRRWYITLPGLLLAVAVTYQAGQSVPKTFQSTSTVILLAPRPPTNGTLLTANPALEYGDLSYVADAVRQVILASPEAAHLRSQGVVGSYEVTLNASPPGLSITTTSPTSDQAEKDAVAVDEAAASELRTFQLGVGAPTNVLITSSVLSPPNPGTPLSGKKLRIMGSIGAVGIAIVLALAIAFDGVASRRRKRRSRGSSVAT